MGIRSSHLYCNTDGRLIYHWRAKLRREGAGRMKWSQETCHVLNEVLFPGEGKYLFLLKELYKCCIVMDCRVGTQGMTAMAFLCARDAEQYGCRIAAAHG